MSSSLIVRLGMVLTLVAMPACSRRASHSVSSTAPSAAATSAPREPTADLSKAAPSQRRIIRNAELVLEVDEPVGTYPNVTRIAEALGGFALSTDLQRSVSDNGETSTAVTVVLRVPAERFETALDQLRRLAMQVASESTTGQDVTEEYLDLEARLRTQRALEAQFLEILKDAKTIKDAMEVHTRLAEVRGEIEKVEGRRRFLESQTSMSTIRVQLRKPHTTVEDNSFSGSVRQAGSDMIAVSRGIVHGAIRVTGVMLPILALIGLPLLAGTQWMRRRRPRKAVNVSPDV